MNEVRNAIEVHGLCRSFKGFSINNIDLVLPMGTVMGLVGENGAGKSTTINLIMNALHKSSGSVTVLGTANDDDSFTRTKQDISVVTDTCLFPQTFTAAQVAKIMRLTYVNWRDDIFRSYLSQLGIDPRKKISTYSKGMEMRLSLAVALSHKAKLLILDEATSGLDPFVRNEILGIINEYTRDENNSVLISSHIVSDLESICDYISFIHNGSILFCEEKDRLLEDYVIIKLPADAVPDFPVKAERRGKYDKELLIARSELPDGISPERADLEDIIIFMTQGTGTKLSYIHE
ncbi:MAG: ABC transporter ATP-binding protein [Oscillospiraceae bacterium]|nr:ABC transporter ATP-binding protein [Oscillospiraceae bacterium]